MQEDQLEQPVKTGCTAKLMMDHSVKLALLESATERMAENQLTMWKKFDALQEGLETKLDHIGKRVDNLSWKLAGLLGGAGLAVWLLKELVGGLIQRAGGGP